jgi:hypothetical protein
MATMMPMPPMPPPPPAIVAQEQTRQQAMAFRAMYDWGFASPSGEGKGTLAVLVDTSTNKVVVELHAIGERLVLLEGDGERGYRLLMPRNGTDERAPALGDLSIPFLPKLNDAADLAHLLLDGTGHGIKVSRRDSKGPKRLRWDGKDHRNEQCTIWLKRTRFDVL